MLLASIALSVLLVVSTTPTEAGAGISLRAEDGNTVYGRTLEWGTCDLKSRLIVIPRGTECTASLPDGKSGLHWAGRYGVAGIDVLEKDALADAMKEKGLGSDTPVRLLPTP